MSIVTMVIQINLVILFIIFLITFNIIMTCRFSCLKKFLFILVASTREFSQTACGSGLMPAAKTNLPKSSFSVRMKLHFSARILKPRKSITSRMLSRWSCIVSVAITIASKEAMTVLLCLFSIHLKVKLIAL